MKIHRSAMTMLAACGTVGLVVMTGCGSSGSPSSGSPSPGDEVSVGFGTQSKEDVTGAVTSIVPSEVEGDFANVGELLRGRVPGLEVLPGPRGGYRIRIRGGSDMERRGEPLLVIDGMRISSEAAGSVLAQMPTQDVKRIDIMRDASSTSIYGMRGQAGVIVITTKAEG